MKRLQDECTTTPNEYVSTMTQVKLARSFSCQWNFFSQHLIRTEERNNSFKTLKVDVLSASQEKRQIENICFGLVIVY